MLNCKVCDAAVSREDAAAAAEIAGGGHDTLCPPCAVGLLTASAAPAGPHESVCDNCREGWMDSDLDDIDDLWQRVEAGGTVPSGQCPACGALCYPASCFGTK